MPTISNESNHRCLVNLPDFLALKARLTWIPPIKLDLTLAPRGLGFWLEEEKLRLVAFL